MTTEAPPKMKRTVPQSPATERTVLGSLMADPKLCDEVSGIHADLFYTPAHRLIYETIAEVRSEGGTPNVIAVTQRIDAQHKLNFVGGAGALTEMLGDYAGGSAAVEYHAQTLRDLHARRRIIDASVAMQAAAQDMATDADSVLQQAGESVLSLSLTTATDSMRAPSAIVPGLLEELEALMAGGRKLGLQTGIRDLDQVTGGLRGGQLTIVAGRPAMGKSALMLNMADNMSRRGIPVVYFSLEMPANELAARVVLGRAETNTEIIRNGFLTASIKHRIFDAATQFSTEPLYVDDRGGLTLLDIRGRARLAVRRWGVVRLRGLPAARLTFRRPKPRKRGRFRLPRPQSHEHGVRRSSSRRCSSKSASREPQRQPPEALRPPRIRQYRARRRHRLPRPSSRLLRRARRGTGSPRRRADRRQAPRRPHWHTQPHMASEPHPL